MESSHVSYRVSGPLFIIQISDPSHLNSLSFDDFVQIAEFLEIAQQDDSVYFTLLQSEGRFFSSGGKFSSVKETSQDDSKSPVSKISHMLGGISPLNVYVTEVFARHSKILVCCLNGPAIGLAASLVALCDIVYSKNDSIYLLCPFTSLGFVAEVGTSVTLPMKLGVNTANEHLLLSTPVTFDELYGKIIVRNYNMQDTSEFNDRVARDLRDKCAGLHGPSLLGMKSLLGHEQKSLLERAQGKETNATLPFWLSGEPHKRFRDLASKKRRHKL